MNTNWRDTLYIYILCTSKLKAQSSNFLFVTLSARKKNTFVTFWFLLYWCQGVNFVISFLLHFLSLGCSETKINFVSCQFKTYFLTFPRIFLHPNYLIQFAFLIVQMYQIWLETNKVFCSEKFSAFRFEFFSIARITLA